MQCQLRLRVLRGLAVVELRPWSREVGLRGTRPTWWRCARPPHGPAEDRAERRRSRVPGHLRSCGPGDRRAVRSRSVHALRRGQLPVLRMDRQGRRGDRGRRAGTDPLVRQHRGRSLGTATSIWWQVSGRVRRRRRGERGWTMATRGPTLGELDPAHQRRDAAHRFGGWSGYRRVQRPEHPDRAGRGRSDVRRSDEVGGVGRDPSRRDPIGCHDDAASAEPAIRLRPVFRQPRGRRPGAGDRLGQRRRWSWARPTRSRAQT